MGSLAGSGKTAAFALPMLEQLMHRNRRMPSTHALVLTPTRELAVQARPLFLVHCTEADLDIEPV